MMFKTSVEAIETIYNLQNIPVVGNDPSVFVVPMISGMDFLNLVDCIIFSGVSGNNLLGPPIVSDFPAIGSLPINAESICLNKIEFNDI